MGIKLQQLALEDLEKILQNLPVSNSRKVLVKIPTTLDWLGLRKFDKLSEKEKKRILIYGIKQIISEQRANYQALSKVTEQYFSPVSEFPAEVRIKRIKALIEAEPDVEKKEKIQKAAAKAMNEEIHAKYLENSQNYFASLNALLADEPRNIGEIRNCIRMIEKNEEELSPLVFASDYTKKNLYQDLINPTQAILQSKLANATSYSGYSSLLEEIYQIKEKDPSIVEKPNRDD